MTDHLEVLRPDLAIKELTGSNGRAMMSLQEPDGKPIKLPAKVENEILRPSQNSSNEKSTVTITESGWISNSIHKKDFAFSEYMWGETLVALEIRSDLKGTETIFWTKYGNSLAVNMENGQISYIENLSETKYEDPSTETPGIVKPGENIGKLIADAIIKSIYDEQNLEDAGGETTHPTEWLENAANDSQMTKEHQRAEALRMLNQFTEQNDHPRKILEGYNISETTRQRLIKFLSDHKKDLVNLPKLSN
jgi:hypothetical protein